MASDASLAQYPHMLTRLLLAGLLAPLLAHAQTDVEQLERELGALPTEAALTTLAPSARRAVLASALDLSHRADRAHRGAPQDTRLLRLRRAATRQLLLVALAADQLELAAVALERLADQGAEADQVATLRQRLDAARPRARLAALLARVRADPSQWPPAQTVDDHVLAGARHLRGDSPALLARTLDDLHPRAAELTPADRRVAQFASRLLALDATPSSVQALGRWLAVLRDAEPIVDAAVALCQTRQPAALRPLLVLRDRLGRDSPVWLRIAPHLTRIPAPPGPAPLPRATELREAGRLAEALAVLDRALEREPADIAALRLRADIHRQRGDFPRALADLDRVVASSPDHPPTLLVRAAVQRLVGMPRKALADASRAIELAPSDPVAYRERAACYLDLGQTARAVADLDWALKLAPSDGETLRARARAHVRGGNLDAAARDLSRAIELDPRDAAAWHIRGQIRAARGDNAGGLADVDRALELRPRTAQMLRTRATLRKLTGDLEGALADIDLAVELAPRSSGAHLIRGNLRRASGNHAGAVAAYRRAIALDPRHAHAHHALGLALLHTGDRDGARAALTRALELLPPRHSARADIRGHLNELGR